MQQSEREREREREKEREEEERPSDKLPKDVVEDVEELRRVWLREMAKSPSG